MQEISRSQPAENREVGDHIPWGWVVLTVVGLEIALVASAVAWVAIYSYLINPGHDSAYYQKYAELASPIVAVVVGIPYFLFACRWVGRKAGKRAVAASLCVWFILFLIDVLLILIAGLNAYIAVMLTVSHVTKMLAAYFGGRAALRDVLRNRQAS
jgi:low temperature requirement protein LtrA